MTESVNGAVRQDIQSIYARGMDSSACATDRPAFINLIAEGRNDPIALFRQQPHQTVNAKQLVLHEAQKNLPADFLQKDLSPEGNKIRTLIGVIYKDVQDSGNADDIAKLDKVCKKLAEANGNENKEQKVTKELSGLVSKYSEGAFEKVINKYIEHCMEAWEDHHQARSVDTHDKAIFKQCLDVCKSTLKHDVEGLTQPDQPWETMAQKLNFFVNDCAAISKTLTFYDAEPVMPAPKAPELLNLKPDDVADSQKLFIPTGPGQGGITLNITSKGGSVGDIAHSAGATGSADSNSAIVKHILDSGLTNVEKVGLIKDLFNANTGGAGNFLGNLAGVQGFRQEQATDTQQLNVARREIETQTPKPGSQSIATQTEGESETDTIPDVNIGSWLREQQDPTIMVNQNKLKTAFDGEASRTQKTHNLEGDNLDEVVLRGEKEQPVRTSLSDGDSIYTTSHTGNPLNRRSSTPTYFPPTDPQSKPDKESGNVVTLADKFEALKQRDPSAFDHLDKHGAVAFQGGAVKPTAEHDLEKALADRVARKNSKQSNRKSVADGFEPARLTSKAANASGNKSVNDRVYTTVRTVDSWNRVAKPLNFLPPGSGSDSGELDNAFSRLTQRNQSAFDNLDNKKAEQHKGLLPFQEKLAEIKRRG